MRTRELRSVLGRLREPAQRAWVAIIQPANRTAPIGAAHTAAGVDTPIGRQATSLEAALGRKGTRASGIPLRKAIQGVTNRALVDLRAARVPTRRNRTVTAAGRAASVAAEATVSAAVAARASVAVAVTASVAAEATASAVVAATAPAADTEGNAVSAAVPRWARPAVCEILLTEVTEASISPERMAETAGAVQYLRDASLLHRA
jgi:hypothetical protein